MRINVLNRMLVAVGISAVALVGLSVPTNAQPQGHQQDQKRQDAQKDKGQRRQPQRLAPQEQEARIAQQEQRSTQYRQHLDEQQQVAEQQSAQLQQQNRRAQQSAQVQYTARLRQQRLRIQRQGPHNYGRDPYFSTPATYRYSRGGSAYETNQYGVDLLRQAVKYGYDEGYRTALADRRDRWASNYEGSYAYQDANYGYSGFYVDREDYNHYFREGFRRGYEDGYNRRTQYGRYANGKATILGSALSVILSFESIR
jgi:hypothetical protein